MDGSLLSFLVMGCGFRFVLYLYLLVMFVCDGMLIIKLCNDRKDNVKIWINSY